MKEKIRQLLEQWEKDYNEYDREAVLAGLSGYTDIYLKWMDLQAELMKRADQLKQLLEE